MLYSQLLKYILLVIFLIFITKSETAFFKKTDKHTGNLLRIASCLHNEENIFKFHASYRRFNRTSKGLDVNMTLTEPFGPTVLFDGELRMWGDGGWKHNYLTYKSGNACPVIKTILGPQWKQYLIRAGAPLNCPIPPGYYHFENYEVDLNTIPVLVQPGRFLTFMYLIRKRDNLKLVCVEAEFEIKITSF